ncbi:MAG: hypothetical protein GX167_00200 [Firmicutes bacterium]|jgi:hypothetical protein|nr:hypothetical protein [Bacillota bacterium]
MQVKPVRRYKIPKYPDKEETLKNPGILLSLPARWRNNAYVAVALSSLLLMTLTACSEKDGAVENEQDTAEGGSHMKRLRRKHTCCLPPVPMPRCS